MKSGHFQLVMEPTDGFELPVALQFSVFITQGSRANQLLSIQSSVSSTNISSPATNQRTFSMRDDFLAPYTIVLARFLPVVFIEAFPLITEDFNPKPTKKKENCRKSLQLKEWANSLIASYWLDPF
jgi:hypothetical protein